MNDNRWSWGKLLGAAIGVWFAGLLILAVVVLAGLWRSECGKSAALRYNLCTVLNLAHDAPLSDCLVSESNPLDD